MKNIALLTLLLLSSAAFADHHERKPDPMLRQLDTIAGRWRCSGTAFASPMAPQHATTAEVTSKWTANGYWLTVDYAEKKTAENPAPFQVMGYFGYDAEAKKLVVGTVDNMGGYATSVSDGWDGERLVFTGPWHMGATTVTGRDTFTRDGANRLRHTFELQQGDQWMKLSEETCTRQ